jgi:hypothetical protein
MPDASQWRSSEIYDRFEDLTASELAWEWLRRNEAYDRDFATLADKDVDPQTLTDRIRQRWGLMFSGRSSARPSRSSGLLASRGGQQRRGSRAGANLISWQQHAKYRDRRFAYR